MLELEEKNKTSEELLEKKMKKEEKLLPLNNFTNLKEK
jgi:hypothetical protein